MKPNAIEIEIKVKIEKSKPLIEFLKKNGTFVGRFRQIDTYFVPQHRNFIKARPAKEWLRLRNADGKFFINYKNWHYGKDNKTNFCDEYETTIENMDAVNKIFSAIDIKPIAKVNKKRQIWFHKDYEVAIDKIKGLGDFVEIEYKGKTKSSPKKITDKMVKFLKDAGCGKINRNYQGYPFLLLFPNEAKYEEIL